jgi:hypothetical protein
VGASPTTAPGVGFHIDPETNEWTGANIRAEKPGYDPVERTISWDDGQNEYRVDLEAKRKTVRIVTDPPMATVEIDGKEYAERDESGAVVAQLTFPPVNEAGDLQTYVLGASKKTEKDEWYPATMPIAWDEGKPEYQITLKKILTQPVEMTSVRIQRTEGTWRPVPVTQTTIAMKSTSEGPLGNPASRLTASDPGTQIDALAMSPDGSHIVFNVLRGSDPGDFRSQIMTIRTDRSGGQDIFTDGRTLDITPSYTPDGTRIVFASNRATPKLSIWEMSAAGAPGVTQLTSGESTADLWPVVDSDPRPRLFYQAHADSRSEPRLFMTPLGNVARTDLSVTGTQPRVSPKGDAIVFTDVNAKTGKRDLYLVPDRGGQAENLTNTPDIDEFDAVWSWDGSRIAFAADRGLDEEKRRNYDIWTMDVRNPSQPTQITVNGSWDDRPVWSPSGETIYFRSNRGGEWGIWKIMAR